MHKKLQLAVIISEILDPLALRHRLSPALPNIQSYLNMSIIHSIVIYKEITDESCILI